MSGSGRFTGLVGRVFACVVFAVALSAAAVPVAAGTTDATILINRDQNPGTGCDVMTVDGVFAGVEQMLVTTVETPEPGVGTVVRVERRECVDPGTGTFGPPILVDDSGWPVGVGLGANGSDVIETYLPLSAFPTPTPQAIRLAATTMDDEGDEDAVLVATAGPGQGPPIILVLAVLNALEIPTVSEWGLILLALLLAGAASTILGRRTATTALLVVGLLAGAGALFAMCVLDGDPSEWLPSHRLAVDPVADAPEGADILELYGQVDAANDRICFRLDVDLEFNQPPVAQPDSFTMDEDDSLAGDVLADNGSGADSDPDGDPLTVDTTPITAPSDGTLTLDADGTFTYTPDADFFGTDSFVYEVSDPEGATDTATVTITVENVNDDPVAQDDSFTTEEDTPLAGDVLADNGNGADSDPDGDVLAVNTTPVSGPSDGTLTLDADGTFTYTPDAEFSGTDSFVYELQDGNTGTDTATVTIEVTDVDDPPVAVNDMATVDEDDPATTIDVLANDTDVDGGTIEIASVTQPTNGSVVITNAGADLTYQPNADYCNDGMPTDDFTYTLNGGSTATVSVTVTCVDDPPTAVDDTATVNEDSGANAIDVLANDTDPDGGPKLITGAGDPANGTVVITGGGTGLTYEPDLNYCNDGSPTDDFTYTITGGDTATVAVTVTCVNDPPVADDETVAAACNIEHVVETAGGQSAEASGSVFRTVADNVLVGDSDPVEGDAISIVQADGATSDTTGPEYTVTTNQGGTVTLHADGSFVYTPEGGDRSVADSFTYTIQDAEGGQDVGTVNLNVGSTCIWFVDNSVNPTDGDGDGTSSDPFSSLVDETAPDADPDDAEDASLDGDVVYVFEGNSNGGDAYAGGYVTEANETVLGEGVDLVVDLGSGPETLFDSTANNKPLVAGGASPGFTTTDGTDVEIAGFTVTSDVPAVLLSRTAAGTTTYDLHDNTLDAGSQGFQADASAGSLVLSVDDNTDIVSDGTAGILLNAAGGTVTVTSLCGNTVHGDTANIGIQANGVVFDADPGTGAFEEVECTDGTTIGSSGNRVGGSGVMFNSVTGDLDLGQLDIWAGTAGGLDEAALRIVGDGVFNAGAGTGFQLTTDSGTLDSLDGPAVDIDPVSLENMVLTSVVSQNSDTVGIGLTEVTGSFQVTGTTTIGSAGTDGVAVTDSSAAVTFTGQLAISTTGGEGVSLDDLVGSFSAADTTSTITGTTGDAFNSLSSEGNITYAGSITNTSANSVDIRNHGGGAATTIAFSGAIDDDGAGIFLDNNDQGAGATINFTGGLDLDTGTNTAFNATNGGTVNVLSGGVSTTADTTTGTLVNIANTTIGASGVTFDSTGKTGGASGILLTNAGSGDFLSDAGSITNQTSRAVDVAGGSGDVVIDNTLSTTAAGRSVEVTNHSGGTVDFNGSITDIGLGIHLDSNTGAVLRFDGGMSVDIAGTEEGFNATGGGTLHVTGTNTVDTADGTGIAVNIANTGIGSDDVTFQSVSANGAPSGIVLNTTGTAGDFVVTGDGGSTQNASGGLLTNITGDAVQLTDVQGVSLDQLNMSNVGDHGIDGVRVDGLSVTNATYTNMGNADTEDVFSFDRDTQGDNGLTGTALFQNLTITNFAERAIDIVNEGTGSLDLDILSVSADNNNDTFGEDAIRVQNEGSVNADVLVSGGTYNNLELDVLAYFAQGSGTNTVEVTGVVSTNGGGPDNNPNGGGIAVIGSAGSTTTFDINANNLSGVQGSVIQIIGLPGSGQTVTLNGTIGGGSLADANTLSTDLADGIDLDFDGDGAAGSAIAGNILVQNNTINFDDDGIGVDHRDAGGTMNVTIRDNTLNAIVGDDAVLDADDGIFIFIDDDVGTNVNQLNLEIINNDVNNLTAGKHVIVVEDVQDGNDVCLGATGNNNGGGNGDIELDTDNAADLVVDATSAANLSALNNNMSVNEVATPTYNSAVDCIP